MIIAKDLVKKYGSGELEFTVLKKLNFEIKDGEFLAIIGPSGSGKSTLLYQLSSLDEPTSGEIHFNGKDTHNLSQTEKSELRLKEMGFVFQDYALLPELNALENVALPILMQGKSKDEAFFKARKSLEKIGLVDKEKNLPSQLSGGQQQRVSIARAIAHEPKVIFADEPTANLDSTSSQTVMKVIQDLHERDKQTIVLVTHEEEYAKRAERIIVLKDGIIESDGAFIEENESSKILT